MVEPKRLAPAGVVFDTDGVITRTAEVHERAWQLALDEVQTECGVTGRPFTHEDYLELLDGRPRYDGVAAFLGSRGIELAWGEPTDTSDAMTVCGVGNRKNDRFVATIERDGVRAFDSTLELVRRLRHLGVGVAVISASRNCAAVLAAAGADDLFDVRVDGVVSAELDLAGKPDPAIFLEAARRLGVGPGDAVVVEDARSGVTAGARGGFALVVGVDRGGSPEELWSAGADVVVGDLGEVRVDDDRTWHT